MSTCSRCGNPITFRYVDGRCVPVHLSGVCSGGGGHSSSNDYSGYSRSDESCCFLTNCPECGDEVFFMRFNGGSVWIDPPLGPPWYKHPCMDQGYSPSNDVKSALVTNGSIDSKEIESGLILGVIKESDVSYTKQSTISHIETEKNDKYVLLLKHNAGFLTGKLVVYDPKDKLVRLFGDKAYAYGVVAIIESPSNVVVHNEKVCCPECDNVLNAKNVNKHLRRQHWFHRL